MLALVTDAFGAYGGIAQYNKDFLTQIARLDDVGAVFVLPRIWDRSEYPSTSKIRMFKPSMNKFLYALRACWLVLKLRPHVIYCGHLYHGPLATRLARTFKIKLISQLHGTEVWDPVPRSLIAPLEQSDKVLCVSEDTKQRYSAQSTNEPSNGIVVHNTVGTQFNTGDRTNARAKFDVESKYALLSVSRLDARKGGYKGHQRVIEALPELLRQRPNLIYLIAGVGDDFERLVQLAERNGVTSSVRFLGKVPAEELPDLYRAADLFVLPSTGEGFGIVYLEAMASGTMALGLNVGGAPDALCDGALGICVDEHDFETALLQAVSTDSVDRQTLSNKTIERFGPLAFQQKLLSALNGVLKREQAG